MVKLNINLDESLKHYVDEQIAKGRARDVDDLMATLLTEARMRESAEQHDDFISKELEASLLKADADPGSPMTEQDWDHIRQQVIARKTKGN